MLMPFHKGKGILEILLERIKSAFPTGFDQIIVATTTGTGDDRIIDICDKLNVKWHRGSEEDVLARFIDTATKYDADKIIRICADNVFLDVRLLHDLFHEISGSDIDYMSYCTSDGKPSIKTHYGLWAEATTTETLKKIRSLTDEKQYHEHVTNYIYTHPDRFSIRLKQIEETIPGIEQMHNLRLTIDTDTDFDISKEIYHDLMSTNHTIDSLDIIRYVKSRPHLMDKMKTIIEQNSK